MILCDNAHATGVVEQGSDASEYLVKLKSSFFLSLSSFMLAAAFKNAAPNAAAKVVFSFAHAAVRLAVPAPPRQHHHSINQNSNQTAAHIVQQLASAMANHEAALAMPYLLYRGCTPRYPS